MLDRRSLLRVNREHPLDESDEILASIAMASKAVRASTFPTGRVSSQYLGKHVILREARPSAHLRVDALTRVLRASDDAQVRAVDHRLLALLEGALERRVVEGHSVERRPCIVSSGCLVAHLPLLGSVWAQYDLLVIV